MINWKIKSPVDMANRIVAADILRATGADKINTMTDKRLVDAFILEVLDEKDNKTLEIDWKFVIFEATDYQLSKIIEHFMHAKKEKERGLNIVR